MIVLDASVVLMVLLGEPGAGALSLRFNGAVMSAANLAEVLSRIADAGEDPDFFDQEIRAFNIEIAPVTATQAVEAARLRGMTGKAGGLSHGDRLCLALGRELGLPVLTADRAWAQWDFGIPVELAR